MNTRMIMDHSGEVARLRATVGDLLALSTIPEIWVGREPPALATELADLLIESLHVDFAFVRLCDPEMRQAVEAIRGDAWNAFPEWLEQRLAVSGQISRKEVVNQIGGREESCCGIVIPIGVNGERGLVAAACYRSGFPDQIDQQLLSVAANSAATAFRNAHLINELRNTQKVLRDREQELRTARDELEIKVAERTSELRRSEFYLAEGQRLAHTGSWAFDTCGNFGYWSRELFHMYGLAPSRQAPTREEYLEMIHPQDRQFMARTIERMLSDGSGCDLKKRIVRPCGEVRYIRCVGVPVFDHGSLKGFVGTAMDVTEQERLTQELRRREAYLEEAQRLSHTGSFGWNIVTGERTWSEETYRILGFDSSIKPTHELVRDRVHPDDLQVWRQAFAEASQGKEVDFEHRLLMPDGSVKHLHLVAYGVQKDGKFVELIGSVRDITEQKAAERAVRRSEGYLSEAQRLSRTGSFGWRVSTSEILWSEETFQIFQYDRTMKPTVELVLQRVHPDDVALVKTTIERASQDGRDFDFENRLLMPDGSIKHLHVVAHAERDESDSIEFVGAVMDVTNQRRAEESLRESESYLAEAQKLSHTGTWAWSPETDVRYWSEECYRVLGFDPRDGLPRQEELIQRIHPDDQPAFRESAKRAKHTKLDEEVDYRIVHPDGAVRDIHSVGHPVFSPCGDLIEYTGTVIDITERKQAEEELRASERKYRNLVDTTPAFIHTASPDGALDFLSRGWLEYGGLTLSDLKDWRWAAAIHPEDVEGFVDKWRAALASGEPFEAESRVRRADGEYCWFLQRNVPFRDETGKIVKWYGTGINITERKRAEEELRASERKYRNLVDTTPALVHTALPNGDLDFFNRGWLEYLGLSITDLLGWRWTALIHPEDVEEMLNKWRASLESGRPFVAESRVRRADGEYRWFLHRKQPQRNEAGEIVKWYGSSIEIEERRIAEEAIRRGETFLAEGQRLSHTGSWGWNASTGKLTWSQEHFRILGLDPKETTASLDVFWERIHPDDRIGLRRAFESAIRDKRDFEQEFRIVTPDWSIRHLHGVGHAVLNKANELVEFIGSSMDITERKRAEERAQSQREAIRLALNAFVEKLDVNHLLGDVITELNKQFHAKSWELWLLDDSSSSLLLHSSSHASESFSPAIGSKNARPLEELQGIWQNKEAARAAQILQLSAQDSLLSRRHGESLTDRGIKSLMIVPLVLGKQNLGFLELHFQSQTQFSSDDLELAQGLVHHATLALQLNRLTRRAEQSAVTEERNRLAREIHDTLAQAFAGIVLHSEVLGASLTVSKRRSAKALTQIQKLARSGLEEARRSVQALRPKALDGTALPEALEQAALRLCEDAKLSCQFRQRGKTINLSSEIQNELFRISQEALTNVVKHAQAKSVCITLNSQARMVSLSIEDDGIGLATAEPPDQHHGFGMRTMRERAQGIGGRLRVESQPGRGTTIRVEVPSPANRSKRKANQ